MFRFRNGNIARAARLHLCPRRFFSQEKTFDKILIANRGEIACRVMKTAKKMGIKTVAIYSEPDAQSLHVRMADEAVCVGPAASSSSYLVMDNIIKAVQQTGAQAVHPGYGFLSENHNFVAALERNGVAFIGPGEEAIISMGDKIASKKIANEAKVNTIPGFLGAVETDEEILRVANEIGYPVMLKASAGGGGKGMRVAWNDEEALDGFKRSKEEAISSFGDDTMFIEKFIESPRHIEIQVLCDSHGNGLWVNERECSIQRRNQKVIEEAPSVFLDPDTRKMMGEQAVQLAKAVNYKSAGTVEFIIDSKKNFYFLEMNTRLQVEHPITEYISGIDLVEQMIRVAAGHPLNIKQEDIPINGWAIESRVYAEDPLKNFLPSIGTLKRYAEPFPSDPDIRCDTGVVEGSEISIYYDPLISKLVTYGPDRASAIDKMRKALDSYVIRGVTSNINFLRALMDHPRFLSGDIDTKFIEDEYPDGFQGYPSTAEDFEAVAVAGAFVHLTMLQSQISITGQRQDFSASKFMDAHRELAVSIDGALINVKMDNIPFDGKALVEIVRETESGGVACECDYSRGKTTFSLTVDGRDYTMQVEARDDSQTYSLLFRGTWHEVRVLTQEQERLQGFMPVPVVLDTSRFVMSPMPGSVFSVNVKEGDEVNAGQEVCVIEAMKMQNTIRAEKSGTVLSVNVTKGQTVQSDEVLIELA